MELIVFDSGSDKSLLRWSCAKNAATSTIVCEGFDPKDWGKLFTHVQPDLLVGAKPSSTGTGHELEICKIDGAKATLLTTRHLAGTETFVRKLSTWHNRVSVLASASPSASDGPTSFVVLDLLAKDGDDEVRRLPTTASTSIVDVGHSDTFSVVLFADGSLRRWSLWETDSSSSSSSASAAASSSAAATAGNNDDDDDTGGNSISLRAGAKAFALVRAHRSLWVLAAKDDRIQLYEAPLLGAAALKCEWPAAATPLSPTSRIVLKGDANTDDFTLLFFNDTGASSARFESDKGSSSLAQCKVTLSAEPAQLAAAAAAVAPIEHTSTGLEPDCAICMCPVEMGDGEGLTLDCGHCFHAGCVAQCASRAEAYVEKGQKINFGMAKCPMGCGFLIRHPRFPRSAVIAQRYRDVLHLAARRGQAEYPGRPVTDIVDKFLFFVCHRCEKPYWGGNKDCAATVGGEPEFDPAVQICEDCATDFRCKEHGRRFVVYKCRYCCNTAEHLCFGNLRVCDRCLKAKQKEPLLPEDKARCDPAACPLANFEDAIGSEHAKGLNQPPLGCSACFPEDKTVLGERIVRAPADTSVTEEKKD